MNIAGPAKLTHSSEFPSASRVSQSAHLSTDDKLLLDRLKVLRLRLAKERGVPAYVIFHDRSLESMAQLRPATSGEFAQVDGVGAVKSRDFADIFLAEIAAKPENSC